MFTFPVLIMGINNRKAQAVSYPVLDHGVIGNGRVLALVSPTSAIEWLCMPRFDSPSVFGRILDKNEGGTFRFLSKGEELRGKLEYLTNTNVLRTKFETEDASWEVIDFAPRIPQGLVVDVPIEIVRVIRPIKGETRISIDFDPRPDYARAKPDIRQWNNGIEITSPGEVFTLTTNLPVPYVLNRRDFVLNRPLFFVFSYGRKAEVPILARINYELDMTIAGWRAWTKTCGLPMFAPNAVLRSALCLKLHVYHDTGAIIAASTTSIPEAMNTPRTWDYRYCWLRDAAFVVEALRRLSHLSEGEKFISYLRDVAESGPLQPLYGIDGSRDLEEIFLPHLAGFGNNGFVRIGNAAYQQQQNDLMGELILCLETLLVDPRIVHEKGDDIFPLVKSLVQDAIRLAPQLDTGIWEFRSMFRHYTFSRAMCWVAMSRGAKVARYFNELSLAEDWERRAAAEREEILTRAYNSDLGFFTQSLDGTHQDASNLLLPTLGIIDAHDKRFINTVRAYEKDLVDRGLMLRYRNQDDFGETTSAFTICSFWWAEALALAGRLDDAVKVFEHVLQYANQVGLFSEDVDPVNGQLLGNFPQAYTHVGLIHAAMTIGELIEARDGKVRAWA